ncbi:hypothetical protein PR003_g23706, partial [Phytophthora rubi]
AAFKKKKAPKRSHYVDVAYVPPTSNEYKRFFSAAKLVLSDVRKSLSPAKLEMLMCLQYNRELWDVNTVEQQLRVLLLTEPTVAPTEMDSMFLLEINQMYYLH